MSDSATITRKQLRTVVIATELGGRAGDSNHFSYAGLGRSTYSFGQLQYDVGHSDDAQSFLKANGFSDADIADLSNRGGLSRDQLNALNAKLQAIPQAKLDEFTNSQLDVKIGWVAETIDDVRRMNPAAADAIVQDPKLQLGIADYRNQFGHGGPQLAQFLAGDPTTLAGGTIRAGTPPAREDIQTFIAKGRFGQDPVNARGIAGREERFNEAMAQLGLGPATEARGHAADRAKGLLEEGARGEAVTDLQIKLAGLGYMDANSIDGNFGMHTRHAVERFQDAHRLAVDGRVGPQTIQALDDTAWTQDAVKAQNAPLIDDAAQAPSQTPNMWEQSELGQRLARMFDAVARGDEATLARLAEQHAQTPEYQQWTAWGQQSFQQWEQQQALLQAQQVQQPGLGR